MFHGYGNELYTIHWMLYTNCNSKIADFKESDINQLSDTLKN